ncbi:MAG: Na+/H+ antiporter NhaC family protein, partial [Vulcanimicrobiota bacterium]
MEGRENEVSDNYKLEVKLDKVLVRGIPFNIKVKTVDDTGKPANVTEKLHLNVENHQLFQINEGKETLLNDEILIKNGKAEIKNLIIKNIGKMNFVFTTTTAHANVKTRILPGLLTLLPPLLAIILALTLKQVVVALLCGIWLGAIFMYDFNPLISFMRVLDTLIVGAISDPGHVSIITFDFFLGGMVALIYRSGGSMGLVKSIKKWAKTPRTGQLATWAMGLFIFFDDYANTLIVGNSMRPLTDKLKISREKLSFIVDATAAPVANVAIISTWIGFELSVIGDSLKNVGLNNEPYMVFVQSIPYRFYPVLMIIFIFLVSYMMKDFGPMLKAEIRARKTGEVLGKNAKPISNIDSAAPEMENVPERWYNAVIPIATVILATIGGLIYTGFQGFIQKNGTEAIAGVKIYQILNNANSFQSLLWASFLGTAVVIILALSQKIMNLEEAVNTWIDGAKAIIPAVIILCLAWTIGDICKILKTGPFLATMAEGNIMPQLLPVIIFVISAVIAFATGTSWGTMSIIMP